ncbi:MAG: polysaccharide biosynthesis/export family protein [Gemmataceae bacterium]|nr:polysaccharide biosynthesis/export family protein [Gemmataceae bacterium]MDW8266961.1 polysaccharide biosynthesis/export family protein [Gemmataceae bacterium]
MAGGGPGRSFLGLLALTLGAVGGCWHAPAPLPLHPNVPRELRKLTLPPYVIEPPDILLVEVIPTLDQPISGQHLVRPDGTISLGIYGSVAVGGMTLDEAREAIKTHLSSRIKEEKLQVSVDVFAYNSKVYYVITDGGGYGEQVYRFPITGSETVLDAISQINGLPAVASKRAVWIARRVPDASCGEQKLLVDWCAITQKGDAATNYQVLPGDRIYVHSDKLIRTDTIVAKILSPFERLMGFTLLTSETINSIRTNPNQAGGRGF